MTIEVPQHHQIFVNARAVLWREGTDGVEYVVQTRDRPGQRQSLEFPGGTVEVHESLLAGRLADDPDQFNAITAAVLRLMQRKDLL
jgi:8-oxo-dGTP pyrophosphatase MutT (NUDIX family)